MKGALFRAGVVVVLLGVLLAALLLVPAFGLARALADVPGTSSALSDPARLSRTAGLSDELLTMWLPTSATVA